MAKTPVSILQELSAKSRIAPPQYDLIHSRSDGVNPEFKYQVTFKDIIAIGSGRSKKEAKHNAAETAIIKLQSQKSNIDLIEPTPLEEPVASPYSNLVQRNYVGELMTMCAERNLQDPKFEEVGAEGPSHAPCFTMSCTLSNFTETAQASTKKQAKQLVAKKLFDRVECLKDILKTVPRNPPRPQRDGEEEEIMFERLHNVPRIPATMIHNSINELHLALERSYPEEPSSLIQVEVDRDRSTWNPVLRLKEVATEMQVLFKLNVYKSDTTVYNKDYDKDYTPEKLTRTPGTSTVWFALATLDTISPVVVMGQGLNQLEAEKKTAEKTLRHLSIMIEGSGL